jgi:hypothetical protein
MRTVGLAGLVAIVCAVFASGAQAADYTLKDPFAQRAKSGVTEYGYIGPRFYVGNGGTSTDYYYCPDGNLVTDWNVVPADEVSDGHSFNVSSRDDEYDAQPFQVSVLNWSTAPLLGLYVVASCTTDRTIWPYHGYYEYWGDWVSSWDDVLAKGRPHAADFSNLIQRMFCWIGTWIGCDAGAAAAAARPRADARATATVPVRKKGNRFALRNGTNRFGLRFSHASRRPPAVYLSTRPARTDCRARRQTLPVVHGKGEMLLTMRCRGLKRGAAARVRIGKPIHRSFRLHKGAGTIEVRLDKPPGTVRPYVHVSTPAGTPCKRAGQRVRLRKRTFDLRIRARCGKVAQGARGHLYVGGLLTP